MSLIGQHYMVLGLARSGVGAINLLRSNGARVTGVDSRKLESLVNVKKLVDNSEILFSRDSETTLSGVDVLLVSPGVPSSHPLTQQARLLGLPVIGEIELAYLFMRGPIMAITGSNGKTTTTSLVGHILESSAVPAQVGGNIGRPATEMTSSSRFTQWNVLEISSFQLETVNHFHADLAAVLNVTPNHLDRHGSFSAYASAKANIFRNQRYSDWAVLNATDETSNGYGPSTPAQKALFNGDAARIVGDQIELFGKRLMHVNDVQLPGQHNLENAMAAAVMCCLAGANNQNIADGIASFKGVKHRLEFVRELNGVRFYNDSKATSVDATLKALEALKGPLWVILGGLDKGGSYRPLAALLSQKAKSALLIGSAAGIIEEQLRDDLTLEQCGDLSTALTTAVARAVPGDTVLLAPACASYDQFESYEHRGDAFRYLVENL